MRKGHDQQLVDVICQHKDSQSAQQKDQRIKGSTIVGDVAFMY